MAKSRIGLDVGSTAVRVAEVTGGDSPVLTRAAQVPLPPGAVENGEVRQPEVVSDALRELWQRSGVKDRAVQLGVGNQRVVVREISLPWLPEKEMRASLAMQVQEYIPMPVDQAVLDYDPVGEQEVEGRRMLRMLLVAAQRNMVDALVTAVEGARLSPAGIDLTPFAIVRAVGTPAGEQDLEEGAGGDEAVVDVGAQVTNICVHDRGIARFVRILPSGGRDITLAIARSLGVDDDVAERLKRGETVDGAPGAEEVQRAAMSRAGSFVDEIRSSLEFYAAQVPGAKIGRVVVTGGGSKLNGFLELMGDRLPVTVDRGRTFERVASRLDLDPEALADAEPVLAVAVGLATHNGRRP